MTNKDLIMEMIESLENNVSNSPFIIDIPNAMKYVIYFNIYKKNNGLGGVGRLNGLTNLLSLVMNIKVSEADSIIEVRNIFAHIFDNNDSTCIFEPNFSIDCYPYERNKVNNKTESKIKKCIQALYVALINA